MRLHDRAVGRVIRGRGVASPCVRVGGSRASGGNRVNLGGLFSRFRRNGSAHPVDAAGATPVLRRLGLAADERSATSSETDVVVVPEPRPMAEGAESYAPFQPAAVPVTLEAPEPSTGDPVLDVVLRRRRVARARLRALRAELAQERRRLADITAFMRPHTAHRDGAGGHADDNVEAQ